MKKANKSIRLQFSIIVSVLLATVILLCVLANSFFLQRYYMSNKRSAIENSYFMFNELFGSEDDWPLVDTYSEEFATAFNKICNLNDIDVVVVDSSLDIVISSVGESGQISQRLFSFIFKNDPNYLFRDAEDDYFDEDEWSEIDSSEEDSAAKGVMHNSHPKSNHVSNELRNDIIVRTDKYVLSISTDPRMKLEYMELMGRLDNGDMIVIRSAVEGITASAKLSIRFFVYVGLLMAIIGALIVWIVSGRVTRPILQLADISNKMTHLDFSAKYDGDEENEIGYLGHHMNELSQTLEKTISELKTANNELRVDLENRERLDEMRSDFISNVSHELKTPIAIIQGYAEGLKDEVNEDPESREYYCDVIIDEAAKMNRMVKNLLVLNQLEFGGEKINIERFDISLLIRNYIQSASVLVQQNNVVVEEDIPPSVFVWGDEYRIEEVFMNYFTNAIHHVRKNGTIKVSVIQNEEVATVHVFNTGDNIPEDDIDKVWTKFYKVDKARSREYGGSGVGLSIVKAIMNMHGKRFGVKNVEGGVDFWFELDQKARV